MSPVSRGRKSKKGKTTSGLRGAARHHADGAQVGQPRSAFAALQALLGSRERPAWFDSSSKAVLDQAGVLMAAQGPRELEQATAELLGAELHRVLNEERKGMWFDWWFEELAEAATARIREQVGSRDGSWEPAWRLLHGLTSIGSPALQSLAGRALECAKKELRGEAALRQQPGWLRQLARITATGEVSEMRDAYGARIALIAGFSYPGGVDRSVFLFDIDACGVVTIVHAGVFDDVQEAASAWRALVGDTAQGARPERIETTERLLCLVHCDSEEDVLRGTESRAVLDNWFRARRRIHDLAEALRKRGMSLPAARSLYHNLDTDPMAKAFTGWYVQRHGSEPDPEVVDALVEEWMEGALPDTWHAASPHRVAVQLALISDWVPDDPITIAAKALLPEWVRWHGEQAGLPEHLIDRAVAVAAGGARAASDCAGLRV
ncbi:MAG: hypothetical protein JO272_00850 [Pseudonocardiales bacterium]|nr:hypothetical protein [Pseudonocardiales bacterium]